jgi:drug/metabolite transporter (DMT)-like permease
MLSATTYSLIGVINKFLTIFLNVILWDKHSTPAGLLAVCICLLSGVFYEQSPRREMPVNPFHNRIEESNIETAGLLSEVDGL